ncbi:TDT family transporter [Clostridium sp. Ade.TY]|uniref:TDT family transporter n=1 Tax=Clostridium sp. Ade.TY TaxID=1391647 RepID=UPI0004081A61|nr:TDT family transporter [Clostridium sp. Ade.TY]
MKNNCICKIKLNEYPIAFVATCLGAVTLTNFYEKLEFTAIKTIFTLIGLIALIFTVYKAFKHPKVMLNEMNNPILMALYPTATMLLMFIGVFIGRFNFLIGKGIWLFAIIINILFIIFFIIKHIIIKFNMKYVLPCWFALLVGISLACTTSTEMKAVNLTIPIFYFVVIAFLLFLPIVIYRLCTVEVPDCHYPLIAIISAPSSLCVMSYLTLFKHPNFYVVMFFFILTIITTLFVYINFPKFFSIKFNPTYAALTFPLAASFVATFKVKVYLASIGYMTASRIVTEISGIEFFIATSVIGFVFYKFVFEFLFDIPAKKFTK